MKIAAIVPMRHYSERVPGKNYRPFHGEPLYRYIIRTLLACPSIDKIIIDTDSPIIREDAAKLFPTVQVYERPAHLRAGSTSMNDVLLHTVDNIDANAFLQTHSTNTLLRPETISQAVNQFCTEFPTHDSLFSVTRLQTRLWDQHARAVNHNADVLLRTQDLPPIYEENSCLYLFTRTSLIQRNNRIGERPLLFEIDRTEAWDIDEELDFSIAEFLYTTRQATLHSPHESLDFCTIHAASHQPVSSDLRRERYRNYRTAGTGTA